jgi:hypothetical protein
MSEILVHRFERYFKHPDDGHAVLQLGDRAGACRNVRAALGLLGHPPSLLRSYGGQAVPAGGDDLFDEALSRAVHDFQQQAGHHWADGEVGPGTRGLLVRALAERSLQAFLRLPHQDAQRSVFLSYAHLDAHKVDPIDGWLRDKQVSVIRDLWEFKAGGDLAESARKAIAAADKVLAMLSAQSWEREWTPGSSPGAGSDGVGLCRGGRAARQRPGASVRVPRRHAAAGAPQRAAGDPDGDCGA